MKLIDIAKLLLLSYCIKKSHKDTILIHNFSVINIKCLIIEFALLVNCFEEEIPSRDDGCWYERCFNETAGVENILKKMIIS